MMHELIRKLRDSLTPESWQKGNYFGVNINDNICMCVHGAGQVLVNPKLRDILKTNDDSISMFGMNDSTEVAQEASDKASQADNAIHDKPLGAAQEARNKVAKWADRLIATRSYTPAHAANIGYGGNTALLKVWNGRPWYVKCNDDTGNLELHYLLGMFGITATFNDAEGTTLEMLHERLNVAADWAEANSIKSTAA